MDRPFLLVALCSLLLQTEGCASAIGIEDPPAGGPDAAARDSGRTEDPLDASGPPLDLDAGAPPLDAPEPDDGGAPGPADSGKPETPPSGDAKADGPLCPATAPLCKEAATKRVPIVFEVVSVDSTSCATHLIVVGQLSPTTTCATVWYPPEGFRPSSEIRQGGLTGTKEHFVGPICAVHDLGKGRFEFRVPKAWSKYTPKVGEPEVFVWKVTASGEPEYCK